MGAIVRPPFPRLQPGHPLSRGLVAAWPFYEGSGTTLNDISGNQNNGVITGGITWVGGRAGYALSFANSTSQYVDIPTSSVLNLTTAATFSAWINVANSPTASYTILSKGTGNGGDGYIFNVGGNGSTDPKLALSLYDGTTWDTVTGALVTAGAWCHAVAVWDGANVTIYVNGVNKGSVAGHTMIADANDFLIGIQGTTIHANPMNGQIDDVRVYNRALSAAEVAQLYAISGAP